MSTVPCGTPEKLGVASPSALGAGLLALQAGGAKQAWVRTEAGNSAATQLYESFGFLQQTRFWYLRRFNP